MGELSLFRPCARGDAATHRGRRRHLLPASDQGRQRARRGSRRARARHQPRSRQIFISSTQGYTPWLNSSQHRKQDFLYAALAKAIEKKFKPLVVTILDVRGAVKVTAAQDGTSLMRAEIAHGKAYGALAMGMGSRALFQRAQEQAYFVSAVNTLAQGRPGAGARRRADPGRRDAVRGGRRLRRHVRQ